MLLIEPGTPPWWKRALLKMDEEYKVTSPKQPEQLFTKALVADLPPPDKYKNCIALALDTGLVWSDGSNWIAA